MAKNTVITITTDFGDQLATSQLRAVIATLHFTGQVIENHDVSPFSIIEGAFAIEQLAKFSPDGSVHVGVIDPGVGTERFGLIIKTKRSWFVGPNNGLLYPTAKKEGIEKVWRINEKFFDPVSDTFHGRDVFIKTAVFLSQGKLPESFSCIEVQESALEKIVFSEGQVIHIDRYGNYKINWSHELIIGKKLVVTTKDNRQYTLPIAKTFEDVPPYFPLALYGSSGTLEIAVNLTNAKEYFKFVLGEVLEIISI